MASVDIPDPDPRPRGHGSGDAVTVTGSRCTSCAFVTANTVPRCPQCGGTMATAEFGPGGEVWASTVIRIRIPGQTPPYGLAYVVLDDGPRVLAHAAGDSPLTVGTRVRLATPPEGTDAGDLYAVREAS